jgi:hypothetical protein
VTHPPADWPIEQEETPLKLKMTALFRFRFEKPSERTGGPQP